jgi:hypothetical protein
MYTLKYTTSAGQQFKYTFTEKVEALSYLRTTIAHYTTIFASLHGPDVIATFVILAQ